MMCRLLVAVVLLAAGVGCVSTGTDRGRRTGPAPAPPWIDNKGETATTAPLEPVPLAIWVPPGKTETIDGTANAGGLILGAGARVEATALSQVSGRIVVADGATLSAPNLGACGALVVGAGAAVVAPKLAQAESVVVGFPVNVDKDERCLSGRYGGSSAAGGPTQGKGARVEAQALARVVAAVLVADGSTVVARALQACGARVGAGAKLDAPCASTASRPATWASSTTEFSECF